MLRNRNSQRGLTLVEVLIVIAVISFLTVTISSLFAEGMRTYQAGQVAGMVQSDLRFALNYIALHLREAVSVEMLDPDPTDPTLFRRIRFKLTDVPATTVEFSTASYMLDPVEKQVMRTKNAGTAQPLCRFVKHLVFEKTGEQISITIESVNTVTGQELGAGLPLTLNTVVYLRNP